MLMLKKRNPNRLIMMKRLMTKKKNLKSLQTK